MRELFENIAVAIIVLVVLLRLARNLAGAFGIGRAPQERTCNGACDLCRSCGAYSKPSAYSPFNLIDPAEKTAGSRRPENGNSAGSGVHGRPLDL